MAELIAQLSATTPANTIAPLTTGVSHYVGVGAEIPITSLFSVVEPDGEVRFFRDIYKYDSAMEQALASGYPYASQ